MDASNSFGSWLRQQRKSHDWTQAELAERVGCSVALIRKYEADERRPSKQITKILADIFAIPDSEREAFFAYGRGIAVLPPNNFPPDQTPFIGRQSELELLRIRIASPECRLLVLTGPGGIGKTRLAIQASRAMAHHFPDGVFFVNLVGVASAEYLVSSIASALALSFHGLVDFKMQLFHHLRTRRLLLLMDNYEHLLPHTGLITEILEAARDVKIVVTSRERLNVQEEWGFPVRGLACSQDTVRDYADIDTIRLFEQRAAQANSHSLLADTDRPFIFRICELVQGNPLAIELAAAWTRMLSCQEIAEAIQSHWDFPPPKSRNVPERHRSMTAVFEHTWRRLSQEERMGFMKLSVFRSGFTQDAAYAVANVNLLFLANLLDKSLLIHSAKGRYEIHELLRRYGEAKLHELPDTLADVHASFIAYYGNLLEDLRNAMWDERHKQAIMQIEVEIDNIRHAWNLAAISSSEAFFGQAAEAMWHYYNNTNLFEEGYAIFEKAATYLAPNAHRPEQALVLAQLFHGPGWFAQRLGRLLEAKTLVSTSLTWLNMSGLSDVRSEMLIKGSAFFVAHVLNDNEKAIYYADECLKIGQQSGDEIALAAGRMFSGIIARATGDTRKAKAHLHEAVHHLETSGSQWALAYVLSELGQVEFVEGDFSAAKTLFQRSVGLFYDYDDVGNAAGTLILLGQTHSQMGHKPQAAACYYEALYQSGPVHALPVTVDALTEIASLLIDTAEWATARDILKVVQVHSAIRQESRIRIASLLARVNESSSPISDETEELTDDLQHAISAALEMEAILRGSGE